MSILIIRFFSQGRLRCTTEINVDLVCFSYSLGPFHYHYFSVHENRVLMLIFPNDAHHSHRRKKLFFCKLLHGVGTGPCRPRDQVSIPDTVNERVRPQPNHLAIPRESMALSNCKPCFSIACLGVFTCPACQAVVVVSEASAPEVPVASAGVIS